MLIVSLPFQHRFSTGFHRLNIARMSFVQSTSDYACFVRQHRYRMSAACMVVCRLLPARPCMYVDEALWHGVQAQPPRRRKTRSLRRNRRSGRRLRQTRPSASRPPSAASKPMPRPRKVGACVPPCAVGQGGLVLPRVLSTSLLVSSVALRVKHRNK